MLALCGLVFSQPGAALHPRRELVVGFFNFAPFVLDVDGKPAGMAVEVMKLAAQRASMRLRWVKLPEGGVDAALRARSIDAFPLVTLTPERKADFYASEPWWENDSTLASREEMHLHAGREAEGKKIAIRGLQTLAVVAKRAFPASKIVIIPDVANMTAALCRGEVDGVFLDVRLLQAQLMKGPPVCAGHPLFVASVPGGNLSLGTVTTKAAGTVADPLYAAIAELAVDGTLSSIASRWSLISSFHSRHMKDYLETRQRTNMMQSGLVALSLVLVFSWIQTGRIRRARVAAEESRGRFDAFMQHTPAVSLIRNVRGEIVYSNRPVLPESLRGHGLSPRETEAMERDCCTETTEFVTLPSGAPQHLLCLRFPFVNPEGERFVGTVALDVSERRKAEDALRFSQFSIDRSPDSILWIDSAHRIFYANEAAGRSLGYTGEELQSMDPGVIDPALCQGLAPSPLRDQPDRFRQPSIAIESEWKRRDGTVFPVETAVYHVEFDRRDFVCCIARDITERHRVEGEMRFQAKHDLLTGLANRRTLEATLDQGIAMAGVSGGRLAVVYFDLDGFKLINDTLGHAFGDTLLKQLSLRLADCMRPGGTLARMGGDEFAAIVPVVSDPREAIGLARAFLDCLEDGFNLAGHELRVTASAGISLYPDDGVQGTVLLQNADTAMYESKRKGKNQIHCFKAEMNAAVRERLELENHLRKALERGELQLHFQPEIEVASGAVIRFEALLRWYRQGLGDIPPAKFIPLAEETGLIVPIGTWVLKEACLCGRRLLDSGSSAGIAVNVSIMQFCSPDFEDVVAAALTASGLPAQRLDLELTETVATLGIDDVKGKIARLRAAGVTISIDDFGTGYSSLNYLLQLHADNLKIDRSFLQNVPADRDAVAMMRGLISLGHSLGMRVVVEGVETGAQMAAIEAMGCDIAQGYYLGFPAPESSLQGSTELTALLRSVSYAENADEIGDGVPADPYPADTLAFC